MAAVQIHGQRSVTRDTRRHNMKTTYGPVVEVRRDDIRDASGGLVDRRVLCRIKPD